MTDQDQRVRENRLRRWAKRLGLDLSKSRARTFKVDDRGGWQVLQDGEPIAGTDFGLDLDNVEQCLAGVEALMQASGESGDLAQRRIKKDGLVIEMPDGRVLVMRLDDEEEADHE